MIKKLREYIKKFLPVILLLGGAGIGGAVMIKAEVGLKAVDMVLEQLEETPTPIENFEGEK
jgi:hypothetical protein